MKRTVGLKILSGGDKFKITADKFGDRQFVFDLLDIVYGHKLYLPTIYLITSCERLAVLASIIYTGSL